MQFYVLSNLFTFVQSNTSDHYLHKINEVLQQYVSLKNTAYMYKDYIMVNQALLWYKCANHVQTIQGKPSLSLTHSPIQHNKLQAN